MAVKNFAVAASADDGLEDSGTVTLNGTAISLNSVLRYGGLSFDTSGAAIAQGTALASAVLTLTMVLPWTGNHTWKGHKVTNSAQFTTGASNISSRYTGTPTTASVTDTSSSASAGTNVIDVTAIVQELVNQAGWSSSSRITLVAKANAGNAYQFRAYDYGSNYATLVVTTAEGAAVKMRHYLDMMR